MRIKSADDKTKRLALLQSLLSAPLLDDWQKSQLNNLIVKMRLGIQGEKDAAHYLDNHFIDGKNHAVIHDFRIDVDGEIAQIDHLLINRMLDFYLLETKNFSGNLTISAHGEFSVRYGRDRTVNIPSPIEQSKRHENVLRRLLKRLGIQTRTGRELRFMHVVLVDPKASIERPNPQSFDSSMVIAADQFRTWQQAHLEKIGTLDLLGSAMNLRSSENLLEIAEKVARQHRPENQL